MWTIPVRDSQIPCGEPTHTFYNDGHRHYDRTNSWRTRQYFLTTWPNFLNHRTATHLLSFFDNHTWPHHRSRLKGDPRESCSRRTLQNISRDKHNDGQEHVHERTKVEIVVNTVVATGLHILYVKYWYISMNLQREWRRSGTMQKQICESCPPKRISKHCPLSLIPKQSYGILLKTMQGID